MEPDSASAGGSSGARFPEDAWALPESPGAWTPSCSELLPARRQQDLKSAPSVTDSTNPVLCPACAGTEPPGLTAQRETHPRRQNDPQCGGQEWGEEGDRSLRCAAGETVTRREPCNAVKIEIWPQAGVTSVMQMASLFHKSLRMQFVFIKTRKQNPGQALGCNTLFLSRPGQSCHHPIQSGEVSAQTR